MYFYFPKIFPYTLQKITAILLLITLNAQPVTNGIIFFDFLLNQEYIKEFLCINKEQPKLACNGKCFLMKQLRETQNEKEQEFPVLYQTKYEFILAHFQTKSGDTIYLMRRKEELQSHESDYVFLFENEIFHPPIV